MKKYLIFLFAITLIIIFIIYINNKDNIKNISSDDGNINYPYFNNSYIDDYIYDIVFSNVLYDDVFIDYDYNINKHVVDILLYKYYNIDNIVNNEIIKLNINLKTNSINKSISKNNDKEYNIINKKAIDKKKKLVAFTFDDGPNYNTSKIIDILNKYNVRATFFVLGCNVEKHKEILKKMTTYNMEIGNHGYNHKILTKLSTKSIKEDIKSTNKIIYNITNTSSVLVRPSYGIYNNKVKNSIEYPLILWNIDTLDWKYHSSNRIANEIINNVKDGDIILMHDIYSATVNAMDIVIPKLLDKGYEIVTVSELFYYKSIPLKSGKVYFYS